MELESSPGLDTTGVGDTCRVGVSGEVPVNKNHVRISTNATLLSQGKGVTVLIKPVGLNACTFLQNPVKLARGLRDSAYGRYPDTKVRTNLRRNLVAVESASISNSDMSTLLKVTKVGTWQVTCSQPGTDTCISGVIGPIHPSVEVSELLELAESGSVKIKEIVQLPCHRQGIRAESSAVKVVFEGRQLPEAVYIDYLRYPVSSETVCYGTTQVLQMPADEPHCKWMHWPKEVLIVCWTS
jgi:hypothetical protein